MDKQFGTIIVDGKIVDLDKTSIDELKKLESKLEKDIEKIKKEIDSLLK
ncbi:MAG: hypothetical protein HFJ18_02065 [Clostridia bacterium]|nr:hypothetical protein [Clostridia bacterium]